MDRTDEIPTGYLAAALLLFVLAACFVLSLLLEIRGWWRGVTA